MGITCFIQGISYSLWLGNAGDSLSAVYVVCSVTYCWVVPGLENWRCGGWGPDWGLRTK